MLDSFSSISISRYNIETVALLREMLPRRAGEIRQGRCPPGRISTGPGACGDIGFYVVEIKFDALADAAERSCFKRLPTSFSLDPDDVDRLREAAGRILAESAGPRQLFFCRGAPEENSRERRERACSRNGGDNGILVKQDVEGNR